LFDVRQVVENECTRDAIVALDIAFEGGGGIGRGNDDHGVARNIGELFAHREGEGAS
jgi:hypothetical protein